MKMTMRPAAALGLSAMLALAALLGPGAAECASKGEGGSGQGEEPTTGDAALDAKLDSLTNPIPAFHWSFTIENGGGLLGGEDWGFEEGLYHLGGHVNMFFNRKRPGTWAGGIALTVGSFDMKYFMAGAGVAVLIPITSLFPLLLEVFPAYIRGRGRNSMGVGGRLWWGILSFNYHDTEEATAGIYMIMQRSVWGDGEKEWLAVWGIDFSFHIFGLLWGLVWQSIYRKK
ncbi:MAG: hypothetical protein ABIJ56_03670 [Pseudomonadota bacterium]